MCRWNDGEWAGRAISPEKRLNQASTSDEFRSQGKGVMASSQPRVTLSKSEKALNSLEEVGLKDLSPTSSSSQPGRKMLAKSKKKKKNMFFTLLVPKLLETVLKNIRVVVGDILGMNPTRWLIRLYF